MKLEYHSQLLKTVVAAITMCVLTFVTNVHADDDWSTGDDAADLSSPGSGATGIVSSGSDTGTLNAGAGDYYDMYITYPLEAESHYRIRFQLGTEGVGAWLTVYDGSGNQIGNSVYAEGSTLAEKEIMDPVGSYYVRIYSPSGSVNDYTLAIYLD